MTARSICERELRISRMHLRWASQTANHNMSKSGLSALSVDGTIAKWHPWIRLPIDLRHAASPSNSLHEQGLAGQCSYRNRTPAQLEGRYVRPRSVIIKPVKEPHREHETVIEPYAARRLRRRSLCTTLYICLNVRCCELRNGGCRHYISFARSDGCSFCLQTQV